MPSVKLENKSARILHISTGGGASISIPPTDPSVGSNPVVLKLDDTEKAAFDANVATDTVQEWLNAGELVITDEPDEPAAELKAKSEPEPPAQEAKGEHKHKRRLFGGESEGT